MEGSAAAPFITFQSVRLGLRSKNKPEGAYFTYSLASRSRTLYIGVAGDLGKRCAPGAPAVLLFSTPDGAPGGAPRKPHRVLLPLGGLL